MCIKFIWALYLPRPAGGRPGYNERVKVGQEGLSMLGHMGQSHDSLLRSPSGQNREHLFLSVEYVYVDVIIFTLV